MGCKVIKRSQVNDSKKDVEVDENTFALTEVIKHLTEEISLLRTEITKMRVHG